MTEYLDLRIQFLDLDIVGKSRSSSRFRKCFYNATTYVYGIRKCFLVLTFANSMFVPLGDGTPMDLWHMSGWTDIPQNSGLEEPKYITPHLMRHVNPAVKLISIFRDPIERYSKPFLLGVKKRCLFRVARTYLAKHHRP